MVAIAASRVAAKFASLWKHPSCACAEIDHGRIPKRTFLVGSAVMHAVYTASGLHVQAEAEEKRRQEKNAADAAEKAKASAVSKAAAEARAARKRKREAAAAAATDAPRKDEL